MYFMNVIMCCEGGSHPMAAVSLCSVELHCALTSASQVQQVHGSSLYKTRQVNIVLFSCSEEFTGMSVVVQGGATKPMISYDLKSTRNKCA